MSFLHGCPRSYGRAGTEAKPVFSSLKDVAAMGQAVEQHSEHYWLVIFREKGAA